jgi:hypothetical protein
MHEQSIIDDIISRLDTTNCKTHLISLICDKQALFSHLKKDIDAGIRTEDIIRRSMDRMPLYENLSTHKVDVSKINAEQAANIIIQSC